MADFAIEIPNSAAIRQATNVLRGPTWALEADGTAVVRFHPSYCHMQPWILTAIAAWASAFRALGGEISVENPNRAAYAWRFGLDQYLGLELARRPEEHEEAGRFVSLRTIRTPDDLSELLASIVTLLHLSENPEGAKAVLYVISEMVRNTLEHSRFRQGGAVVAAQLYTGTNTNRRYVSIGVADAGVGVRASLSENYDVKSDAEAVLKAVLPGVSGARRGQFGASDNAGAGLFVTRRLADATGGYFALGSGSAMFRTSLAKRPRADEHLVFDVSPYRGTIVCVEIGLDEPGDFSEFLGMARTAFGVDVDERRPEVTRKVKFG